MVSEKDNLSAGYPLVAALLPNHFLVPCPSQSSILGNVDGASLPVAANIWQAPTSPVLNCFFFPEQCLPLGVTNIPQNARAETLTMLHEIATTTDVRFLSGVGRAARALRGMQDEAIRTNLLQCLRDPDPQTRFYAAVAMDKVDESVLAILREGIWSDNQDESWRTGMRTLLAHHDPQAYEALTNALDYVKTRGPQEGWLSVLKGASISPQLRVILQDLAIDPNVNLASRFQCAEIILPDSATRRQLESQCTASVTTHSIECAALLGNNPIALEYLRQIITQSTLVGVKDRDMMLSFKVHAAGALLPFDPALADPYLSTQLGARNLSLAFRAARELGPTNMKALLFFKDVIADPKLYNASAPQIEFAALALGRKDSNAQIICEGILRSSNDCNKRVKAALALGINHREARQFLERAVIAGGDPYFDAGAVMRIMLDQKH